ncbi:MAG: ABC transporter ATP-binding protein [Candidatus Thermoplasmatota archaeon]|nr:ABC transporter ATP-binding protein [Candidatus Thermoplasmatota archaeon]
MLRASSLKIRRGAFSLGPINLELAEGQGLIIAGRNASGKSTLLEALSGALRPSSGRLEIVGRTVFQDKPLPKEQKKAMKDVGVQLQNVELFEHLTVEEHIQFFADMGGFDPKNSFDVLERCPTLSNFGAMRYGSLSAGKKQLLHFVLALGSSPKVLFLDEPTAGMDKENRAWVWSELKDFKKRGGALALSSHDGEEMQVLGDTILVLDNGKKLFTAKKEDSSIILGYETVVTLLPPFSLEKDIDEAGQLLASLDGSRGAEFTDSRWHVYSSLEVSKAPLSLQNLGEGWTITDMRKADLRDVYDAVRQGRITSSEQEVRQ